MAGRFLIYGLTDPRTGEVRYIGKSSSGMERPRQHGQPRYLKKSRNYKVNWIRGLLSLGLCYGIVTLEECASADALCDRERWWIAFARAWGLSLTNLTDGGEGNLGWNPSAEWRAKNGKIHSGWKLSEEQKELLRAARARPEVRAKMRANALARRHTDEERAKIGAAHRGRRYSAEVRARMSDAARRRGPLNPERRERHVAVLRAVQHLSHTPEAEAKRKASLLAPDIRRRLSEANKGRKKNPEAVAKGVATRRAKGAWHPPDIADRIRSGRERARILRLWGCAL